MVGQPKDQVSLKLSAVQALGLGSTTAQIVFVDEWWPVYHERGQSIELFKTYMDRSQLDQSQVYLTCAEKRWMYSEDEWHEALAMELSLIRPRMVVCLGNRRARKILLKVKDMVADFRWFYDIPNHYVVKRFYHDDAFYIEQLNNLAIDFQYDQEVEGDLHRKSLAFVPRKIL